MSSKKNKARGTFEILCKDKSGRPFVLERLYGEPRAKADRIAKKWRKRINIPTWVARLIS